MKDANIRIQHFSDLHDFYRSSRESLVDEAIARAKAGGYTVYTTTLRAAWDAAIDNINAALRDYEDHADDMPCGIFAETDYRHDVRFSRLRDTAQFHRGLGVTLQMYIGLFKMFRDLYTDTLDKKQQVSNADLAQTASATQAQLSPALHTRRLLTTFFDAAEISMLASWSEAGESERLRELQSQSLITTLEKDKYLAIFESLREPAFLLDHDRHLLNANQMANALFRASAAAAASAGEIYYGNVEQHKALQQIVDVAHRSIKEQRKAEDQAQATTADNDYAIWLDTPQGERCFDIREREILDACDNKAIGYVLMMHDVTAHRQATEKAVSAEKVKSAFLATMSHEIRSPLHTVLGATELLRAASRDERSNYLDSIEMAGKHLLETLTKVLDYSRCESGATSIQKELHTIEPFVREFSEFARSWAQQSDRKLIVETDSSLTGSVFFDAASTRQILSNLVANAIYHGQGDISVVISQQAGGRANKENPLLNFEITDQGCSLKDCNLSDLFEPFFRNTREANGTGLGLAICKHLAESMHGSVSARIVQPTGYSSFSLSLPLQQQHKTKQPLTPPVVPIAQCVMVNARHCLIVDDDTTSATITADHLKRMGIVTHVCHTASAALLLTQQRITNISANKNTGNTPAWHYFLIDYQLPDSNGAILARRIRALLHDATPTHPGRIVALTANAHLVLESDHQAFDLLVTKPAGSSDLMRALFSSHRNLADTNASLEDPHPFTTLPPASVQTILQTFLQNWAVRLPRFFSELAAMQDHQAIIKQAHRLASSASSIGLTELSNDLLTLENALRNPCSHNGSAHNNTENHDGQYWIDRLEIPMRRAPIQVREMAERMTKPAEKGHNDRTFA